MLFSEACSAWREIPNWASFLLRFGYEWPVEDNETRRVALISMPCDSAAAGLVTLGAMRKRLEIIGASDKASHFQRLKTHAIDPNCNRTIRHISHNGTNTLTFKENFLWAKKNNDPRSSCCTVTTYNCNNYYFDGEPPLQMCEGDSNPYAQFYSSLIEGAGVIDRPNLSLTDSGVCLAGRAAGGKATKTMMDSIRFKYGEHSECLGNLLSVCDWTLGKISRTTFFNSRTEKFDRQTQQIRLVIADGDAAFLTVLGMDEFQTENVSVIGVINRVAEREKLEAVGSKFAEKRQWYQDDTEIVTKLGNMPLGIFAAVLKRS